MSKGWLGQAVLSLAVGCATAMVLSEAVLATPEISQQEQQGCLVCHTAVGKADLNDLGRYYRVERTLEGYQSPDAPADPERNEPDEPGGDQ